MAVKFELYRDSKGQYRWRLTASNARTIATAGEGYASKHRALVAIRSLQESVRAATVLDLSEPSPGLPVGRVVLTEEQQRKPIWELVDEVLGPVPEHEIDRVPHDGAENHDHYLYGAPKKVRS